MNTPTSKRWWDSVNAKPSWSFFAQVHKQIIRKELISWYLLQNLNYKWKWNGNYFIWVSGCSKKLWLSGYFSNAWLHWDIL